MTSDIPSPDEPLEEIIAQSEDPQLNLTKTTAALRMTPPDVSDDSDGCQMETPDSGASQKIGKGESHTRAVISSFLKDKEQEWASVAAKQGPKELLDLPLDILREIVKEVTHTNDLTALALTHSALHNLAIPHIYSRFDIVWPDAHATTDPRTGVDALTYGLATLCMGDVFTDHTQGLQISCFNCGAQNNAECSHGLKFRTPDGQRRLGNQYPQFTRKFSLGNGPKDWVQEYLITKESGKMLGTLVALAVARMVNLETFVWDMPTGVLRDVWLALSSLQNRKAPSDCRLERVWVRWHDNSDSMSVSAAQNANTQNPSTLSSTMSPVGWTLPAGLMTNTHQTHSLSYAQSRVEFPTLSALPALKSLSVLDIDELDYLDEMSVLIAKSQDKLRELRVGISDHAAKRDFALPWDGPGLQQVDHQARWPGASTVGERRLGGVLGILLGRVYDIRKKPKPKIEKKESGIIVPPVPETTPLALQSTPQAASDHETQNNDESLNHITDVIEGGSSEDELVGKVDTPPSNDVPSSLSLTFNMDEASSNGNINGLELHPQTQALPSSAVTDLDSLADLIATHTISSESTASIAHQVNQELDPPLRRSQLQGQKQSHFSEAPTSERTRLEGKLRLQTLELERVSLSVVVLQKAFDWSVLTNLTMLDCAQHDRLWAMLRKTFAPTAAGHSHGSSRHGNSSSVQYHLNLRKIHTDAASPALISFLKETLAPNTLETLFLQDRKRSNNNPPSVLIDAIYRGPLKRHRTSLKRLMIDSADRIPRPPSSNSQDSGKWKNWMLNREVLNFITSGRMSSLRELSVALEYKDWHHFLQRLPQIPHLRSLNIPFIADHVTVPLDPKELALQVVDVIVLRPEVELCYMGVSHKCFEILENRPHDDGHSSADVQSSAINGAAGGGVTDEEDEEDDGSDDDEDEEEEEDDNGTAIGAPVGLDPDETESEASDHDDSDADSYDGSDDGGNKPKLRLREILFYDDKVSIFKARHGKL